MRIKDLALNAFKGTDTRETAKQRNQALVRISIVVQINFYLMDKQNIENKWNTRKFGSNIENEWSVMRKERARFNQDVSVISTKEQYFYLLHWNRIEYFFFLHGTFNTN